MLNEYPIDPGFNKNLAFSYQPPPEINTSKLPLLAENWLGDLQKIICEVDKQLPAPIFDKHVGKTSEYQAKIPLLKQLQLIYHRLQGNLDSELDKLSSDNRQALISKLIEEIHHCSQGFHNRVNIIVDSFHKPRNLAELLYTVRKELVEEVASTLTHEVHAWNRISVIAASDGLGIKANFPEDTYVGALSETLIRRKLQEIFYKKFTPLRLPCLLISTFMDFIPELEIEKNNEHGLSLEMVEKIIRLIKRFLPDYINEIPQDKNNWQNYFKLFRDKKNPLFSSFFVNIDWEKMYQSFFYALSDQNYFKNIEVNTLMDHAYYDSLLGKKPDYTPSNLISKLFKEEKYSDLLAQLVELNTRFPTYYQKISKNKVFTKNCLAWIDYLARQLKISREYSTDILQGFHLIIRLDLRRKNFIIEKMADAFLVKNRLGFNILMLAAMNNPDLVNDIFDFIKTHETIIDPELAEKMFLMKNSDNCNALMIAANKQAKVIVSMLGFLPTYIGRFANDTLHKLFTQRQKDSYTAVTLTARDHPDLLKNILSFISNYITINRETLRKLLFSESSNGSCAALMLAIKNQADAAFYMLKFISNNVKNFDPDVLREMFLAKNQQGFTLLMLAARYQPKALQFILAFFDEHSDLFPPEFIITLFLEVNEWGYNSLMLAARYQYDAVVSILNFIKKHPEVFSSTFIKQLLLVEDKDRCNALMIAATYQIKVVGLLLAFLAQHINPISMDTLQAFIFKKIHDKEAANAVFFGGRYDYQKSVMSVIAQVEDRTAINALLKFIEDHIELLGMRIFAELLTEKNNKDDYIFQAACSKYPFIMKKVLNFIADSADNKEITPIQDLSAYFIFEQLARWSIETDADNDLLNKVLLNCSALLLIYFNKDFFAQRANNLKIVTDKLFSCYLNELDDRKIKKITYTTKFSFFKWRYSTAQKLEAAQSLEKVLSTKNLDKGPALLRLKNQYPALSESRLGNLFAAYQEIDTLKANDVCEFDWELGNDAMHSKQIMIA